MHRATLVYIVLIIVFAAALAAILIIGSGLTPPMDVRGHYRVLSDAALPGGITPSFSIEQSGKFAIMQFDGGLKLPLRLSDQQMVHGGTQLDWEGGDWKIKTVGKRNTGELEFTVAGPVSAEFRAQRDATDAPDTAK